MSTFVFSYSPQDANGIVTVTVTRTVNTTNPNRSETLTATLGGTATYGSTGSGDYTLVDGQGLVSGGNPLTLRFNDGTVNQLTFTLDMRADLVTESPETVNFNFTSNRGAVTLTNNTFTITDAIECFMPGTMILTPSGEVAVETLKIGDLVLTHDGRSEPVRWMGRHTVSTVFADKLKTLPVRIKANALDDNVPSRDLLVSPGHAILVDGALVQAAALINGSSIIQETDVPQVFTYHHVELAGHSLIVAENTPAETFVDNVERARFDNAAEYAELYPDAAPIAEMDLPLAMSQRQVASATRRRLSQRGVALYGKALAIAG